MPINKKKKRNGKKKRIIPVVKPSPETRGRKQQVDKILSEVFGKKRGR